MLKPNRDAVKVLIATRSCVTLAQLSVATNLRQAWIRKHAIQQDRFEIVTIMRNAAKMQALTIKAANKALRDAKLNDTI